LTFLQIFVSHSSDTYHAVLVHAMTTVRERRGHREYTRGRDGG